MLIPEFEIKQSPAGIYTLWKMCYIVIDTKSFSKAEFRCPLTAVTRGFFVKIF